MRKPRAAAPASGKVGDKERVAVVAFQLVTASGTAGSASGVGNDQSDHDGSENDKSNRDPRASATVSGTLHSITSDYYLPA